MDPNDVIGHEMLLKRFEWLQIPAMIRACRELNPAAFIDVGANFGLYTCIIGRQRLANRLIAFEPNRWALERLRAHIDLNGLPDVEIHETAAGAKRQTAVLFPGAPGYSALSKIVSAHPDGYDIEVVSLDEILSFSGQTLIIKVDVEGYELQVLEGAKELLARNFGYVQIESFDDHRASAVIDRMASFGWHLSDHIVDDLVFRRETTLISRRAR